MNEVNEPDHKLIIAAYNKLLSYSADKRHLVTKISFDERGGININAMQINDKIKKIYGLDVFTISEKEKLIKYEEILAGMISDYAYNEIMYGDNFDDEVAFIQKSQPYSLDKIKSLKFNISGSIRNYAKHTIFSIIDIERINRSIISAYIVPNEEGYSVFCINAKKKINGVDTLFFLYGGTFTAGRNMPGRVKKSFLDIDNDISPTTSTGEPSNDTITLGLVLAFNAIKFEMYSENPVKFFLKIIDMYGLDLKFEGTSKKLFTSVTKFEPIPNTDFPFYIPNLPQQYVLCGPKYYKDKYMYIHNAFGINISEYLTDHKNKVI